MLWRFLVWRVPVSVRHRNVCAVTGAAYLLLVLPLVLLRRCCEHVAVAFPSF